MGQLHKIGNKQDNQVLALLAPRLPIEWQSRLRSQGVLEIKGSGGKTGLLAFESRMTLAPRDVPAIREKLRSLIRTLGAKSAPLVVAPFLSSSVRRCLIEAGLSYADNTGNMRILLGEPALFIETQGAERNPDRKERQARSLKGPKAGRIIRSLCDGAPPFAVRKLAEATGINAGYVSRVMSFLESEDLIERRSRGPVTVVRWRRLIERWADDYSFQGSNRVIPYLEPRDIGELPRRLAALGGDVAVTGSAAAAALAPVAPTRLVAAFVESPEATAEQLGLRPAETGANVLLAEPYDPVVFERIQTLGGVPFAAPSQAAVDLMTSPGRGPSEAQALLDWMQTHEPDWRR